MKDFLAIIGVVFILVILLGFTQRANIERLEEKTGQDCTVAGTSYICTDKKEESK